MSRAWYHEQFELDVENPGYGQVVVSVFRPDTAVRRVVLEGPDLGEALRVLTQLALDEDRYRAPLLGLGEITRSEARELLPSFQGAVLLAGAGTERYERMTPVGRDEVPLQPICVTCGEGSEYTPENHTTNPWCTEHGHHPFGQYAGGSWSAALELHERRRTWWDLTRDRLRIRTTP